MRRSALGAGLAALAVFGATDAPLARLGPSATGIAWAQPGPTPFARPQASGPRGSSATHAARPPVQETPRAMRARFGLEVVERLVHSSSLADKLRGFARASALGTPDAIGLLARAVEPNGEAREGARAMLEVARALAPYATEAAARGALIAILDAAPSASSRADTDEPSRLQLARDTAAMALARAAASPPPASPDASERGMALEALVQRARGAQLAQSSALRALAAVPPAQIAGLARPPMNPGLLKLLGELGDVRALDAVHGALRAREAPVRAAALIALGALRDMRGIEAAQTAAADLDVRVRIAATEALVALDAPDRAHAVEELLGAEATAAAGARLAESVPDLGVVRAVAARAAAATDPSLRAQAIAALGRQPSPDAVRALLAFARDPRLASDVASAIARSPSPAAAPALAEMASTGSRRLAVRAMALRALVRQERMPALELEARALLGAPDGADRAVGAFALVAVGELSLVTALGDADPRVRRSAVLAAHARPGPSTCRALRSRLAAERDPTARALLAVALAEGDLEATASTSDLVGRVERGGPDAPIATLALAARGDEAHAVKVSALLASRDPVLRSHAARGLARAPGGGATGKLARAYHAEVDPLARRALVLALAQRDGQPDALAIERVATLALAASFDPDPLVRLAAGGVPGLTPRAWIPPAAGRPMVVAATEALAGAGPCAASSPSPREVAWLRVTLPEPEIPLPPACAGDPTRRSCPPITGVVLRADGLAVPVAFDDDGHLLLPGMPPGGARLILAPRPTPYESAAP